jgi:hypothetical protein
MADWVMCLNGLLSACWLMNQSYIRYYSMYLGLPNLMMLNLEFDRAMDWRSYYRMFQFHNFHNYMMKNMQMTDWSVKILGWQLSTVLE